MNQAGNNGMFAIHFAAVIWGTAEITSLLLAKGAGVNQAGNEGMCPIHLAAEAGNTEVTSFVLAKGADVNVN